MFHAIFSALGELLAPLIRLWVNEKVGPVRSKDSTPNSSAQRRWNQRVQKFKSRIRPRG